MHRYGTTVDAASESPPNEAWLFAQAILGRAIRGSIDLRAVENSKHEELTRLAQFSSRPAGELHKLQAAAAEVRHDRELLEWAAEISTKANEKLRALQQTEAREHDAWRVLDHFCEGHSVIAEWNETDHPRASKGTSTGGQWVSKGGGGSVSVSRPDSNNGPGASGQGDPNPHMLELAHTWWQTKAALGQALNDIEELPRRIASERAQLGSGGRYAYIHSQNLEKAERDLETAKAVSPELEKQLGKLEQKYRDAGYDEVPYSTFTPAETIVGGVGIEQVGRAVARGGAPAGLQSTGIEFDIVSAALAGPAILRLGKAVLNGRLGRAVNKIAPGPKVEPPATPQKVVPDRGGRYGYLEDPPTANTGKPFTSTQRKTIFSENKRQNGGLLRDDQTGESLIPPQQRKRGVPAPPNEAQIDHVYPRSRGGPNTYSNAEVRSRLNNIRKGKKIE